MLSSKLNDISFKESKSKFSDKKWNSWNLCSRRFTKGIRKKFWILIFSKIDFYCILSHFSKVCPKNILCLYAFKFLYIKNEYGDNNDMPFLLSLLTSYCGSTSMDVMKNYSNMREYNSQIPSDLWLDVYRRHEMKCG